MNKLALFRPEALEARQTGLLGEVVLIRPVAFTVFTIFAVVVALVIIAFFIWGSYTKRSTVSGQLVPDTGLIKLYARQPGTVLQNRVVEGQSVKSGDVLFVLSNEIQSSTQGDTQALISQQVESRAVSLQGELAQTRLKQRDEREALLKKIAGLQIELQKIDEQIDSQKDRVSLSQKTVARYQDLLSRDFISQEDLQQKQEVMLDQRSRLESLERDRINTDNDLTNQKNSLAGLAIKDQNDLAQIARNLTSTRQELTESEAKRSLVVTAPESGTATAILVDVGQAVDTNKSLVSIVPTGARLQAELYAPSSAVGFIKAGDKVMLRYQAYPYQKFGQSQGVVASVAKTTLPASELSELGHVLTGAAGNDNQPTYRITVNLAKQTVEAYGQPQQLQAGMLLDADILQETRHLYEWVLEPLYSLTGKL